MLPQPTVLLHHVTAAGSHYDWLIGDPREPEGRLWTARTMHDSRAWARRWSWAVQPIGAHRRHYLTWQGPIAGGRGAVRRVDAGRARPRLWSADRIVVDLRMRRCAGRVELRRMSDAVWIARWV